MHSGHRNGVKDVRVLVEDLNPVLRGWGNYFRCLEEAAPFGAPDIPDFVGTQMIEVQV